MFRYIAKIIIEAKNPICVGSDRFEYNLDAPVDRDFNGLPYIPGTAIAGSIRAGIAPDLKKYFGSSNEEKSLGSNVIISDAYLFNGKEVLQRVVPDDLEDVFYKKFKTLPIRTHAKHDHKGTTLDTGLFNQEVVYRGSRFKFEIILETPKSEIQGWKRIIDYLLTKPHFFGSGQYNGYGLCEVISISTAEDVDFEQYIQISNDLNDDLTVKSIGTTLALKWNEIKLDASETLLHFGAGFGDADADAVCYREEEIIWENNCPTFRKCFVIPASSIKGPVSHLLAFYFNKNNNISVESLYEKANRDLEVFKQEIDKVTDSKNDAVAFWFGKPKKSKEEEGQKGNVIFQDIFIPDIQATEVKLMHNTIDRFTGGTLDTALFSEKAINVDTITIKYYIENYSVYKALDDAIADLKNGIIPLGGMAAKGHGVGLKPLLQQ